MKKAYLVTLIMIVALIALPSFAQANLLVNGDFEGGSSSPWVAEWGGGNLTPSGTNPQHGSLQLRNYYDGGMYQDVSVTSGMNYKLTAWAYVPSGGTYDWGSYIGLYWLNSSNLPVGGWQTIMNLLPRNTYNMADSSWITAPATTVKARVRFGTYQNANDFSSIPANPTDFDNFDFTAIPEPSSLILLGTGLMGLLGFGIRKK